jgi:hypothetical protein
MKTEFSLEYKDISGYLAYGLHIAFNDEVYKVHYATPTACIEYNIGKYDLKDPTMGFKPVLRPFSDMFKSIIHNENKIIPVIEMAKMYIPGIDWHYKGLVATNHLYEFGYDHSIGFFCNSDLRHARCNLTDSWRLFDYMEELMIDYKGLIDKKLAIPVYRLKKNPYALPQ